MRRALFICTGNYYRSRFAEHWFNHQADRRGLRWRADSRGLLEPHEIRKNRGYISPFAQSRLEQLGLSLDGAVRDVRSLAPDELADYQLVVAMDEVEHRPMIEARALRHPELVYWDIRDVRFEAPATVLPKLQERVEGLIEELLDEPNG